MYIAHCPLIETQNSEEYFPPRLIVSWELLACHREHKMHFINFHSALRLFKGIRLNASSRFPSEGTDFSMPSVHTGSSDSSWWNVINRHANEVQQNLKGNYNTKIWFLSDHKSHTCSFQKTWTIKKGRSKHKIIHNKIFINYLVIFPELFFL